MGRVACYWVALCVLVGCYGCKPLERGDKDGAGDFRLVLLYGGCRGKCPAYRIDVGADGLARYEGYGGVEMLGRYEKRLGPRVVRRLVEAVEEGRFWDFGDGYGVGEVDLPMVVTEVRLNGRTKRVEDVKGAPLALKVLEARLEGLVGENGWSVVKSSQ